MNIIIVIIINSQVYLRTDLSDQWTNTETVQTCIKGEESTAYSAYK
jgi:hypothetical protein